MKRMIALLLMICVMMTGCRLATEEVNNDGMMNRDTLVGVVVTTEYLDLFDLEAFLKDNPQALKGGEINPVGSEYQNRIYAQEEVEESTTEDGVPCTTIRYNFDHVEGIQLLAYEAKTYLEDGTLLAQYTSCVSTEGIYKAQMSNKLNEGTIFVPEGVEATFFTNPVYQDSEGRLYLIAGTGMSYQNMAGSMWQTLTEEYTETANGEETETAKREFKIIVEAVKATERIAIIQMSGDHMPLDRQEYDLEEMPEELTPVDGCAYILVEEYADDELKRTMIEPDEKYITVYVKSDKIFCTAVGTEILWPSM